MLLKGLLMTCPQLYIYRCIHRSLRMSKVFVRNASGEERLQISFKFPPDGLNVKQRVFNFDRIKNEELNKTLARISASVSKVVHKKYEKKSKVADSDLVLPVVSVTLLSNEDIQVNGTETNEQAWVEGRCLRIEDHRLYIHVNVPTVRKLCLPEVIMIGFASRPLIQLEFGNESECRFVWYRKVAVNDSSFGVCDENTGSSAHPANELQLKQKRKQCNASDNWQEIHWSRDYVPTADDADCILKLECQPARADCCGETVRVVAKNRVIQGPADECPFEKRHHHTTNLMGKGCFRFVSYNILADIYADSDFSRDMLFPYCPAYALDMNYRKLLLIKEITGYNADIICLQEVDRKIFEQDLLPNFKDIGFSGLLSLKTGDVAEGTATFFRCNKFRLLSQHDLPLASVLQEDELYADLREKICKSEALREKVFARTSVLQVTVLESTDDAKQQLLVATAHLYFHPRAPHIRIIQAIVCLRHIERVLAECYSRSESRPAVVFCGDFNSYPESGLHTLVTQKRISASHSDWYAGGKVEFIDNMDLCHTLDLSSACGYPRYTNFVTGFCGCLDYIYVEPKLIRTLNVVPLPDHEEVTRFIALPNAVFPSDHIALVCDLSFVGSDDRPTKQPTK